MRSWIRPLVIGLVIIAGIVLLRTLVFRPKPVVVSVWTVDTGRVEDLVVNSRAGTVESKRRAEMSPAVPGLVVSVEVEKGDRVERGQLLLRLDDSEQKARVAFAARSLDAAAAVRDEACLTAEQAERALERALGLADADLLATQTREEAETEAAIARAACTAATERIREARAGLSVAEAELAKTRMVAPFDGIVLAVTAEVGEWISPSPPGVYLPAVVDLLDPSGLYVRAPVDEADIARIRTDLPTRITVDAFPGRAFAGKIVYMASVVETQREQNRTLSVDAALTDDSLPPALVPGLSADVEILLEARDDALRLPTYALLEGDHVLRVDGDRLEEIAVDIGLRNWSWAEVRGGLGRGDRVVVSLDRPEVKDGARVHVDSGPGD